MKRLPKNLTLISMGLLIFSCNEKISPELKNGSATGVPVAPSDYYFRVVNDNPTILNYFLHKTGPGNFAKKCEVTSDSAALSGNLYTGEASLAHDSKKYDISCYFDTEELSLFYNGLSFKMEASKNTCEYVAYSPYSYYAAIPGATSASWSGIKCNESGTADLAATGVFRPLGVNFLEDGDPMTAAPVPRVLNCDEMVDTSIADTNERLIIPLNTGNAPALCMFSYAGRNCDTGIMSYSVYEVYDADSSDTGRDIQFKPLNIGNLSCGGSITACVDGAIDQEPALAGGTRGRIITDSKLNEPVSMKYTLPKLIGATTSAAGAGNFQMVNFRRGLASLNLDYNDYDDSNYSLWLDPVNNKKFDPSLMEKFAANQTPGNTRIIDFRNTGAPAATPFSDFLAESRRFGYTAIPFAADPFLGTESKVSPFYTFYCLDRALEIKARIRMVVRDFDRVFPTDTSELELISDVFKPEASRRQDLPNDAQEVPGDPDDFNLYNDINDWDVIAPLARDPGDYVPGVYWRPDNTEPRKWWSRSSFPF